MLIALEIECNFFLVSLKKKITFAKLFKNIKECIGL